MADLRVAVEPSQSGRPTQRIYLDGHEMSGVRRVRVGEQDGLDRPGPRRRLDRPARGQRDQGHHWWTRGPARAYRRPDVFDGARDCYTRLLHVITVLGVFMDQALLEYANDLRKGLFGSPDR